MAITLITSIATGFAAAAGVAGLTFSWAAFAISAGFSLVARALTPKPDLGTQMGGQSVTTREAAQSRKIVYGRARIGGNIVYLESTGTDNKYLYLVIAVAGHEIDAYESVWFNDEKIWNGSNYVGNWGDYVNIGFFKGDQTTADNSRSNNLVGASDSKWTNDHKLLDTAYMVVRLTHDVDKFASGLPNISTIIRGKKVLHTAEVTAGNFLLNKKYKITQVGTTNFVSLGAASNTVGVEFIASNVGSGTGKANIIDWSQNPALCIYDYLRDAKYGLGETAANILTGSVIAAKTICDQSITLANNTTQARYTINGVVDTSATIKSNIELMIASMAGRLIYASGQFEIHAGNYVAPAFTVDESQIVGDITVQTKQSRRNAFNGVKGVFLSEEDNYILADYPAQISSSFATEDGDPIYLDMALPFTTNHVRAQRLAKLALFRSRQQEAITIPCNLSALRFKIGDNIKVSNVRLGYDEKVFEVVGYSMGFDAGGTMGVDVQAIETAPSIWDWTASDEEVFLGAGEVELYSGTVAKPPTSVQVASDSFLADDGTFNTAFNVSWTSADDAFTDRYLVEWKLTSASAYFSTTTKSSPAIINNLQNGETYNVRVTAINELGVSSTPVSPANPTVASDTTAPNAPTSVSANGEFEQITINWTNPTVADFSHVLVYRSNTSNGTYALLEESSGTTFVDTGLLLVNELPVQKFYKLRSVDNSGNATKNAQNQPVYSAIVNATTTLVPIGGIADNAVDTDQIADLAVQTDQIDNNQVTIAKIAASLQSTNYVSGSAGWKIQKSGVVEFEQATIRGSIIASDGAIGGFDIAGTYLKDAANTMGLSSVVSSADDVRFWAGNTFANRATAPFFVTKGGALKATKITVSGTAPLISIGTNSADTITLSTASDYRMWVGSSTPENAKFSVHKDGTLTAKGMHLQDGNANAYFSPQGFTDLAYSEIAANTASRVSKFESNLVYNLQSVKVTLIQSTSLTLGIKASNLFSGLDLSSVTIGSAQSMVNALADIPDNFTLKIQKSTTSAGSGFTDVVSQTYTKVTTGSSSATNYRATSAYFVPSGTTAFATPAEIDVSNHASVTGLDENGDRTLENTATYAQDIFWFRVQLTTTDTSYDTSLNNLATWPRSFLVEDNGSTGFNVISANEITQAAASGDITGVEAGTNLNGGGESGDVILNLDSTITGDHTFSNNLIIEGNLTVQGTTTTVDTDDLNVKDKNITLNYSTGDSSSSANGAGITIQDAVDASTNATILWDSTNDKFDFSHKVNAPSIQLGADAQPTLSGDGNTLRIQTTGGYFDIGANNSGFAHLLTDRTNFYFNRRITVDTGEVSSYDENLTLMRVGSTTARLRITAGSTISDQPLSVTGNIAVTGTVDGVDIATRNGVLTSTTTTANAALPKSGGVVTGYLDITNNTPFIRMTETNVTNTPTWWVGGDGGDFNIRLNNTGAYPLSITTNSTNNAVSAISLGYDTTISGTLTMGSNAISSTGTISSGAITATADADALKVYTATNGSGAGIEFSDQSGRAQKGRITFFHGDTQSYGSGSSFVLSTTEATHTVLADGKLMFKEGLYLKPSSGTGAGTLLISSSGNLTNIGTISSGAITSTGTVKGTIFTTDASNSTYFLKSRASSGTAISVEGTIFASGSFDGTAYKRGGVTFLGPSNNLIVSSANVSGLIEFDSLSGTGSVAITNILDEDDMASNSATALATQQSIKAYVLASVNSGSFLPLSGGAMTGAITSNSNFETATDVKARVYYSKDTNNGYLYFPSTSQAVLNSSASTLLAVGGATKLQVTATGTNVFAGTLSMGGQEIVSAARNLTNIGTIDSGAISASGTITLSNIIGNSTSGTYYGVHGLYPAVNGSLSTNASIDLGHASYKWQDLFLGGVAEVGSLKIGSTEVINSSRNLTNIGTINSGAITSTGTVIVDGGTGASSTGVLHVRQSGDGGGNGIALTSSNATSHRIWKSSTGVLNIGSSSNTNAFQQDLTGNITVEGTIASGAINITSGGLSIGGQEVINSSRQLTNISIGDVSTNKLTLLNGASANMEMFVVGTGTATTHFRLSTASSSLMELTQSGNLSTIGTVAATGGTSTNWNTAYTYSQVGHLPLAGGTITGNLQVNGTYLNTRTGYDANRMYTMPIIGSATDNNPERGRINFLIASLRGSGKKIYLDEDFSVGVNSISPYNNSGGTGVLITRVTASSESLGAPNSSGYVLKIVNNGNTTSPSHGGFVQTISSARNKQFIQVFQAKLPTGYTLHNAENSQGTNPYVYWLTSQAGTGKFEWYARAVSCGNTGTFSGGGHVYVQGTGDTFTWYLASCTLIDISNGNEISANVLSASGGTSTEWNTGYDYSQIGHLPLAGGTLTGDLLIHSDNAEINLRSGAGTTSGAINWTFNTNGTDFASIKLPYATRASIGLHLDSNYPITVDGTTSVLFAISGSNKATINNSGLTVVNGIAGASYKVGSQTVIDASRNVTTPSVYLNDTNTRLHEGGGNALRITTSTGYIDIGSQNSGFIHFQGNKPYYFNQPMIIDNDLYPYTTAGSRNIGTTSNVWNHVHAKGYFIDSTEVIDAGRNITAGVIRGHALSATNARISTGMEFPVGHYSSADTVFEIDPTWTQAQLAYYFGVATSSINWSADATAPDGYAIRLTGGVSVGGVYGSGFPYIPVGTDDIFYMECWIKNVGTNQTHYMGSNEYNQNFGNLGGNPGSYGYWVMSNTNPTSSWTKVSGYITGFGNSIGQFESGTKYWTPMALFNYGAGSGTRACDISGWKIVRVNHCGNRTFEGNLQVDGNVNASQVGANNILGNVYKIGSTTIIDSSRKATFAASGTGVVGLEIDSDVGASITLGNDGTYGATGGGRYTTLGFSGTANGTNRIFALNSGADGIYICSATSRNIYFRANGGGANTFTMTSAGDFQAVNTTVINTNREFFGTKLSLTSGGAQFIRATASNGTLNLGSGNTATALRIETNGTISAVTTLNTATINAVAINASSLTTSGDIQVNGNQVRTAGIQARVKYAVWSDDAYGIGMLSGYTFGAINNDYCMTFQMNNDSNRGFWWGDTSHTNAQGAMALSTDGYLTVASGMRIGFGESDTTHPSAGLQVSGNITSTGSSLSIGTTTVRVINGPFVSGNVGLEANSTSYGCYMQGGTTNYAYFTNVKSVLNRRMEILASTSQGSTTPNIKSKAQGNGNGVTQYHINFTDSSSTVDGRITSNGYATSYTTTSDYRVKEDERPMSMATPTLLALRPINFQWKGSDLRTDGFFAHEVAELVPDAVVGEKDATEEVTDDDDVTTTVESLQALDQAKLIPLLVKTIQELEARITALESA